ncbi:hypothetical protein V2H45_06640 [Tumidithrix elongata RA019]|uniref:Transmembrane protein n=1 Tax=Tumidithrix elongata BACA0141 TaxID=2716417 RepID=A0AAW9Q0P4_9CYAN|nr:hypothetical protein [Tumidithrix elongata RA019]
MKEPETSSPTTEQPSLPSYALRDASHYINQIDPAVLARFDPEQLEAVRAVLDRAIPRPSPKIVDLRFMVDLVIVRFYIVLFVGKDRRYGDRQYPLPKVTKFANIIAAILLLLAVNLAISAFVLLLAYLVKSGLGIDLFPGHVTEQLQKLDQPKK